MNRRDFFKAAAAGMATVSPRQVPPARPDEPEDRPLGFANWETLAIVNDLTSSGLPSLPAENPDWPRYLRHAYWNRAKKESRF